MHHVGSFVQDSMFTIFLKCPFVPRLRRGLDITQVHEILLIMRCKQSKVDAQVLDCCRVSARA